MLLGVVPNGVAFAPVAGVNVVARADVDVVGVLGVENTPVVDAWEDVEVVEAGVEEAVEVGCTGSG